jgi:hypothetical protein
MNQVDMARFQQEEMLRYRDITDDADAVADIVIQLSIYYKDPDIDKFLDMPSSRLHLLVKEIGRHEKEMAAKMKGRG